MPRRTYPRRDEQHAVVAYNVIRKHETTTGQLVTMPVPIDLIVELTYGLNVLYDEIPEAADRMILGALFPAERHIVMNSRHVELFERVVGPERFTLAHELGHWIYDADDPDQLAFDLDGEKPAEQFCYHRGNSDLSEDLRIREMNANKLASHLLMPEHLVKDVDVDEVMADFRGTAAAWGVSQQALRIRLETLQLIDDLDIAQLDFE